MTAFEAQSSPLMLAVVMPIIHPNKKLLALCSRGHSRQSGHKAEERQNNQTRFLRVRSTGPTEGAWRVNQYLRRVTGAVTVCCRQQRREAPRSGSPSLGAGPHSFLNTPGILAGLPQASCAGLNGERHLSRGLARGCVWKTVNHKSAQRTRPLGEPGQENNLATSTCQIAKQQIDKKGH